MKELTRKVLLEAQGGAECPDLALQLPCGETACPQDCDVSGWGNWSACSARCDGGVQERNRVVTVKPIGNGVACPHLVDMRLCNTEACTSDCELLQWTSWTPCSKACNGGKRSRTRGLRDEGKTSCPAADSQERLQLEDCNADKCGKGNDVECRGADPMDIALLLDGSGLMTQDGFNRVKELSLTLVSDYAPSKEGNKISVATFAKEATIISGLTDVAAELNNRIKSDLHWNQGPSNVAPGLLRAAAMLASGGRKAATSLVLVVTKGRIADPFLARQAAERLKKSGVRLAFALVGTDYERNIGLFESMASMPQQDNLIEIPSVQHLDEFKKWSAKRIVESTCSKVSARSQ